MANIDLDIHEKAILAKGLKFIPTPKSVDKKPIMDGHKEFSRKIKLSFFFHNKPVVDPKTPKLFKEKSSWEPDDKLLPPQIIEELDKLKVKLGKLRKLDEIPNITDAEYQAFENLQNRKDLVFKKADKGNAIVIMDRNEYIKEAMNQLEDKQYYKKISEPVFPQICDEVNTILETLKANHRLTGPQVKYLSPPEDPKSRTFYMLPKIHKPIEKWSAPGVMPKGRPIVSDCGSDSYRWSELVDHFLKPLSNIHPSYVKNTDDFIEKISQVKISDQALLVTCDVESLYTNIQAEKGVAGIRKNNRRSDYFMPYHEIS